MESFFCYLFCFCLCIAIYVYLFPQTVLVLNTIIVGQ